MSLETRIAALENKSIGVDALWREVNEADANSEDPKNPAVWARDMRAIHAKAKRLLEAAEVTDPALVKFIGTSKLLAEYYSSLR